MFSIKIKKELDQIESNSNSYIKEYCWKSMFSLKAFFQLGVDSVRIIATYPFLQNQRLALKLHPDVSIFFSALRDCETAQHFARTKKEVHAEWVTNSSSSSKKGYYLLLLLLVRNHATQQAEPPTNHVETKN